MILFFVFCFYVIYVYCRFMNEIMLFKLFLFLIWVMWFIDVDGDVEMCVWEGEGGLKKWVGVGFYWWGDIGLFNNF